MIHLVEFPGRSDEMASIAPAAVALAIVPVLI